MGVIITLSKSKVLVEKIDKTIINKFITEINNNILDSLVQDSDTASFFYDLGVEDELRSNPLSVNIIEHAPKIFKAITLTECLDEDMIINSLLKANIKAL